MSQERLMILEKVLSELPGYLGWMIGSCRFSFGKEAGGNTPGQMQHSCDLTVLRSDARLAEVEIRNLTTEDQLRVMLVNAASGTEIDRETTGKQYRDIRLPSSQKESEAFLVTREAIDIYLKESRDGNLIHSGEAAVVPGTAFGDCGEGFLRISYAYSLDDLKEAISRLERFIIKLRKEKKHD